MHDESTHSTLQVIIALLVAALLLVAYDDWQQREAMRTFGERACHRLITMPTPADETEIGRTWRVNFTQGFCESTLK